MTDEEYIIKTASVGEILAKISRGEFVSSEDRAKAMKDFIDVLNYDASKKENKKDDK